MTSPTSSSVRRVWLRRAVRRLRLRTFICGFNQSGGTERREHASETPRTVAGDSRAAVARDRIRGAKEIQLSGPTLVSVPKFEPERRQLIDPILRTALAFAASTSLLSIAVALPISNGGRTAGLAPPQSVATRSPRFGAGTTVLTHCGPRTPSSGPRPASR